MEDADGSSIEELQLGWSSVTSDSSELAILNTIKHIKNLYRSHNFQTFSSTIEKWLHIYGITEDELLPLRLLCIGKYLSEHLHYRDSVLSFFRSISSNCNNQFKVYSNMPYLHTLLLSIVKTIISMKTEPQSKDIRALSKTILLLLHMFPSLIHIDDGTLLIQCIDKLTSNGDMHGALRLYEVYCPHTCVSDCEENVVSKLLIHSEYDHLKNFLKSPIHLPSYHQTHIKIVHDTITECILRNEKSSLDVAMEVAKQYNFDDAYQEASFLSKKKKISSFITSAKWQLGLKYLDKSDILKEYFFNRLVENGMYQEALTVWNKYKLNRVLHKSCPVTTENVRDQLAKNTANYLDLPHCMHDVLVVDSIDTLRLAMVRLGLATPPSDVLVLGLDAEWSVTGYAKDASTDCASILQVINSHRNYIDFHRNCLAIKLL